MPNVTKEISNLHAAMTDGKEWIDIECDGCSAPLGACPDNEYPDNELNLCSQCTPNCCSYTRLEQVDPIKYAHLIAQQKKAIKDMTGPSESTPGKCATCGVAISKLHVYCADHSIPF